MWDAEHQLTNKQQLTALAGVSNTIPLQSDQFETGSQSKKNFDSLPHGLCTSFLNHLEKLIMYLPKPDSA